MSSPTIASGVDGVIANGNVPIWILPVSAFTPALDESTTSISAALLTGDDSVKIDCLMDMGGATFARTPTTRDRQRACEKNARTIRTGQTIDGSITAIYDQQDIDADSVVNAAYDALPEGEEVVVVIAYGHDSLPETAPNRVDIYRCDVQTRSKNDPVQGEDLMFTATLSADLYLPDVTVTAGGGGEG